MADFRKVIFICIELPKYRTKHILFFWKRRCISDHPSAQPFPCKLRLLFCISSRMLRHDLHKYGDRQQPADPAIMHEEEQLEKTIEVIQTKIMRARRLS